jgi:tellurite resistance protein TehA-like permease
MTSTRGTGPLSRTLCAMPESKSKRTRYTAPPPKKAPPSKLWVPAAMVALLACGLIVIVTNYLNLLPGADTENRYLLLGIVLISGGFLMATNYR